MNECGGKGSSNKSFIIHPDRVHSCSVFVSPIQENILGIAGLLGKTLQTVSGGISSPSAGSEVHLERQGTLGTCQPLSLVSGLWEILTTIQEH